MDISQDWVIYRYEHGKKVEATLVISDFGGTREYQYFEFGEKSLGLTLVGCTWQRLVEGIV